MDIQRSVLQQTGSQKRSKNFARKTLPNTPTKPEPLICKKKRTTTIVPAAQSLQNLLVAIGDAVGYTACMKQRSKLRRYTTPIADDQDDDTQPVTPDSGRSGRLRLRTLDDLDGRTRAARRALKLVADIEADLGGPSNLSTAQRELVRRSAVLGAIIGDIETDWLECGQTDLMLLGTLADRQRRCLLALGLQRVARDVSGTEFGAQLIEAARAGA